MMVNKRLILNKVLYKDLNSRQKENYNFHKIAAALADYGFNSMRLNDDWQGADFISVHIAGEEMLKIQLKGRFSISKKYLDKEIFIAFIEEERVKLYYHDDAISLLKENILKSESWVKYGSYSWGKTPKIFHDIIKIL